MLRSLLGWGYLKPCSVCGRGCACELGDKGLVSLTLSVSTPCASCQGTTLFPNLSSVLKDETVWEKPLRFHPEHFLDAQGHFVKHEAFMPFSAGAYGGLDACLSPGWHKGGAPIRSQTD